MTHFTILNLPTFNDSRGVLTVLDGSLPFKIERVYWIYDANSEVRGGHRHYHTHQALIAIAGTVSVYMNDGVVADTIELTTPNQCLLVAPKDWHTMNFSPNAVLLVMASHPYDRGDYIDTPYAN